MRLLHFLRKQTIAGVGVLAFGATSLSASASTIWDWDYSTSQSSASGTFVTVSSPDAGGGYLIIGITGMRNGQPIDGLQAAGTSIPGNEPYTVDNLVSNGPGAQLTSNGFGFSLSDGTYCNPFYASFLPTPTYLEFFSNPGVGYTELSAKFSATPVPVPEPATLALVLGGLLVVSCLLNRGTIDDLVSESSGLISWASGPGVFHLKRGIVRRSNRLPKRAGLPAA